MHTVLRFVNVDEEPKEVFSNLVTLRENLELDLQEDNFPEHFGVQYMKFTNEDLMKLETQKKDKLRQEEDVITKTRDSQCRQWQGYFLYMRRPC